MNKFQKWSKALLAAVVTGVANSFLSALGISAGQALGIDIAKLDIKQLAFVSVLGGIVGCCAYLKQSPVPSDEA